MARWRQARSWRGAGDRSGPGLGARLALVFFGLSILLTITVWLADVLLRDSIEAWAESKAINLATRAIASALAGGLSDRIEEATLAVPLYDERGRLKGFQYEMGAINRLEAETALEVQQALQRLSRQIVPLPLGQLTGLHWMAGWGPPVPIRMVPVGHVRTAPRTEFTDAGINQVLHRIYVDVQVHMRVVAPFMEAKFPVQQHVVLTERVMVGDVPEVFVQWGSGAGGELPATMLAPSLRR